MDDSATEDLEQKDKDDALYKTFMAGTLRFLAIRMRSQKEVRDYLKKKNVKEKILEKILEKLIQSDFINDRKFAQWLIESRQREQKPRGKSLIRYELKQKGVDETLIDELLLQSVSDSQTALHLILQKKRRFENLPVLDRQKKISSFLQTRGYNWETISEVLKHIKQNGFIEV